MAPLLTVSLPVYGSFLPTGQLHRAVELARAVEGAGLDGVLLPEHVVMGPNTDAYPYGAFPLGPDVAWPDPLVLLAAMAAATEEVRLQTGVLVAPARPAPVLAKEAATLDARSGGRLDLGVGTGWQAEELEACGVPFHERGRTLTDVLGACRALWGPGPASFTSPTVSFEGLWCEPSPARPGGPVVLVAGGLHQRNLERIAALGDGWLPIVGTSAEDVAAGTAALRDAFAEAGRDPAALRVRGGLPTVRDADGRADLDATLAGAEAMAAAGATEVSITLRAFVGDVEDAPDWLQALGRRWSAVRDDLPSG